MRKGREGDVLWVIPVGRDPLRHVRVTPHEIAHELLGVDIGGQDVTVLRNKEYELQTIDGFSKAEYFQNKKSMLRDD